MSKQILYIDMDGVLVDFDDTINKYKEVCEKPHREVPWIFSVMQPMPGAVEAWYKLSWIFDCYILSTPPWRNPVAWQDKRIWVEKHFGESAYKKLILTHRKDLAIGDYLIDDRTSNGAKDFQGKFIQFGTPKFPNWDAILLYLLGHV